MKRLINGNFTSISDAELMAKISNDSSGMVKVNTETEKEPADSEVNDSEKLSLS